MTDFALLHSPPDVEPVSFRPARRKRTILGMAAAEFWIRVAFALSAGIAAGIVLPQAAAILFSTAFLQSLGL